MSNHETAVENKLDDIRDLLQEILETISATEKALRVIGELIESQAGRLS